MIERQPSTWRCATLTVSTAALRTALLAGCVLAATLAAGPGQPEMHLVADADLARLLRGMAHIKAGIVPVGTAPLLWRFGKPMPTRLDTPG